MNGILWRYVLKATPERVLHEAVYRKPNKKGAKFSYAFVRDWDEAELQYAIKQDGFGLNPVEAKKVRQNASLISTAAQYGVEMAQHLVAARVSTNLMQVGRLYTDTVFATATAFFHSNEVLRERMEALLRAWDLGLSGVAIRKVDFPLSPDIKLPEGASRPSQFVPFGVHMLKDGTKHELPMMEESSGTKTAFVTLWYLLNVLSTGGVAVIDELESDMHPHMIEPLLELFANSTDEPSQGTDYLHQPLGGGDESARQIAGVPCRKSRLRE